MRNLIRRPTPDTLQQALSLVRFSLRTVKEPLHHSRWEAALAAVHSTNTTCALEIHMASDRIEFVFASDSVSVELLKRAVTGVINDVAIGPFRGFVSPEKDPILASLYRSDIPAWAPLRALSDFEKVDPIGPLLEAVQPLAPDESVLVRFLTRPASREEYQKAYQAITRTISTGTIWDLVARLEGNSPRGPKFEA